MWFWLSGKNNERRRSTAEVPDLHGALPRIAAEFERARRYERTVTVAVFTVAPAGRQASIAAIAGDRVAAADHESETNHLCPVVREAVRETDLVVCDPVARRCVVVMPEIGPEEGRRAVARMRELCASRLQCPVRGDLAVFPRDGWVFPDLVEVAQKQAQSAAGEALVSLRTNESLGS